jgi:hypothetical protein
MGRGRLTGPKGGNGDADIVEIEFSIESKCLLGGDSNRFLDVMLVQLIYFEVEESRETKMVRGVIEQRPIGNRVNWCPPGSKNSA